MTCKRRWGRAGLSLQVFFPWHKNNFEAGFSRAKVYDKGAHLAIAAGRISNFGPRKAGLKIIFRPQEENLFVKAFISL
jgi:hypothetical protein